MSNSNFRTYVPEESVVFFKTKTKYGCMSNMAAGYPIIIGDRTFLTSEALYQCCKFPANKNVQQEIINARSPMGAKIVALTYKQYIRPDWDKVKVRAMRWCLRQKLRCSFLDFRYELRNTKNLPIVELSYKDDFWGAKPRGKLLYGQNVLGRLLMELRGGFCLGIYEDDKNKLHAHLSAYRLSFLDSNLSEWEGIN